MTERFQVWRDACLSEAQVEAFCLGRLSEVELESAETHLLICPKCQDRVEREDSYIRAMRMATRGAEDGANRRAVARWLHPGWAARAGIAAAAAIVMFGVWLPWKRTAMQGQVATLSTLRGIDKVTVLKAGAPFTLRLDSTGLPDPKSCDVTIVSRTGLTAVKAKLPAIGSECVWIVSRPLATGSYWVRLLHPTTGEVLREFALQLR